jgi:NADH-quinone oxidoreductase subunit F
VNREYVIIICDGTGCIQKANAGATGMLPVIEQELKKHGITDRTRINHSGGLGMCEKGPIMVVNPGYTIYGNITAGDIPEIIEQHLVHGKPVARLAIQEDHLYNRFYRIFGDTTITCR